jgi:hypothetical protein
MNGWAVFWAVLSGTLVFVLGQIILQFVIVPVQDFLKTIAAIAHARVEHAQVTGNPGVLLAERMDETSRHLRKLSAQLHSHLFLVRPYVPVSSMFNLPSRSKVMKASKSLIGLRIASPLMPTKKHTSGTPKGGKVSVKPWAFTLNRMIGGQRTRHERGGA